MKRIRIGALIFCCAISAFQAGYCQKKSVVMLPHHDPSTRQGMEGGMWRTDANFESILHLKNVLVNHTVTATPILYMEDGTEYQLSPVTLNPAGVASVNITTALNDMPPAMAAHRSMYGMVGVKYNWSWPAMMATIRNIDETQMVSFYSSLHSDVTVSHSAHPQQTQQQIDGLWWKPYPATDGFLFLSNTVLKPIQISLTMYDSAGTVLTQRALALGPHQSTRLVLSNILGNQTTASMGSLRISYLGPQNGLSATGGLEDDTNGFSATLNLEEMHPEQARNPAAHQVVIDAPGIMVGEQETQMQFPENTFFMPYGYLHNTSPQPKQVTITATAAGPGGAQLYTLGALKIAPYSTAQIDYKDALKQLKLPPVMVIDVSVAYIGNDGDVMVEEGSVDQSGNYVFQVEPQAEAWTISRTVCYWALHDETDSMISLWNYSSAPEDLKLTLYYTGGKYVVPIHLEPRQDYELDLATLIHSGQPDASGSLIPQTIIEGSAILADAKDERNHIEVASSTAVFNVRTGTCGNTCQYCNGISEYVILPGSFPIPIGDSVQGEQQETYNTGAVYYVESGNWSSTNGSIATINTGGIGNGVSAGGANFQVYIDGVPSPAGYICNYGNPCPIYNVSSSAPVTVQIPAYFFSPSYTTVGLPPACVNYTGYFLDVLWYTADQTGTRLSQSGISPGENSGNGWNDAFATPTSTRSDGSFDDVPYGSCYSYTGHYCQAQPTRDFRATRNGTVYPVNTYTDGKDCTDGIQLIIEGNPSTPTNQNKTYSAGNTQ